MRRESADQVAEAARRRLALLGRELGRELDPVEGDPVESDPAGSDRVESDRVERERVDSEWEDAGWVVRPVPLAEPGRHSRRRPASWGGRGVVWLQDRLPATLQGRVSLGAGHVAVLAVVAAVALAVTAYVAIRARPSVTPVPQVRTSSGATDTATRAVGAAAPAPAAASGPSGSPSPVGVVVVDVAGKVRRPGVATLPAGSRVVDAIRKAGGARPGVDLTGLNLARVLVDGEQILVGVAPVAGVAASASAQPGAADGGSLVNLNTATLDQLDGLPGVGPVTAQKILDWRSAHGAFTAIDELLEVDGIGEAILPFRPVACQA
jgi:competence protein ComEA